jgi:L-methionine (R)-S-oxide reductase
MQEIVSLLRAEVTHYNWVGIYLLEGGKLVLAAWDGPEATEHTSIDVGEGICGLAARTKETVIVDDVHSRPEYLACFPSTKSEIVVPIMRGAACRGEIDIDSDIPGAFTGADRLFLEKAAAIIAEAYSAEGDKR